MKILHRDPRESLMRLVPEVLDDLYHLAQVIEPGDRVRAVTFRTAELTDDVERRGKVEKKKMTLTLRVESVEFHAFSDRLRVHGVIEEGPQDLGLHHTFSFEADGRNDLALVKPDGWRRHQLDRLERAVEDAKKPILYVVSIEEDEATLAAVHHYGVREISSVATSGRGKMYASKGRDGFLDEVVSRVVSVRPPEAPLLVVGPGWTRERLIEQLRQAHPEHGGGVATDGTGQAGMTGVHEAIRRGALQRVVQGHTLARDTELVDRLFAEIAKGAGLAAYGVEETLSALGLGAVETLLVTDRAVRSDQMAPALRLAEETATTVHVLSVEHDAGKRLEGFGGIGGILRFRPGP